MKTTPLLIGYARVSTSDQNLDLQIDALRQAGCETIFRDSGISGTARQRPELDKAMALVKSKPGAILVVWKLDRLGRSLAHLIELIRQLGESGCHFRSTTEGMDTSTSAGRLLFNIVGSLAEFERTLIVERTKAGLVAARNRGQALGRRPALTPSQVEAARTLIESGKHSPTSAAKTLGVGRSTLYRSLNISSAA